jgi:hypothetical protein
VGTDIAYAFFVGGQIVLTADLLGFRRSFLLGSVGRCAAAAGLLVGAAKLGALGGPAGSVLGFVAGAALFFGALWWLGELRQAGPAVRSLLRPGRGQQAAAAGG